VVFLTCSTNTDAGEVCDTARSTELPTCVTTIDASAEAIEPIAPRLVKAPPAVVAPVPPLATGSAVPL